MLSAFICFVDYKNTKTSLFLIPTPKHPSLHPSRDLHKMLGGSAILFVLLAVWPTFVVSNISYVGYGHHILNGDIIQIMGTAKRIVKSNEDLKEYKGPNSCNVALDEKNGDIILNYNKVKETGCVVDLLTDSWDGQFEFNATVDNGDKELKECLKPRSSGVNSNM
uniref:Uncharacterized protein n=1 Tax=Meloidogyne enterolobii TaxID=390850 RepID=A0A6V7YBA6_MELEN|nr:unnamed protein product [Meloidogyne enterolobii]